MKHLLILLALAGCTSAATSPAAPPQQEDAPHTFTISDKVFEGCVGPVAAAS